MELVVNPSELMNPTLIDVWVTKINPKEISSILEKLRIVLPLNSLSHLKRIKKENSKKKILTNVR
jgi:hypothetical protein